VAFQHFPQVATLANGEADMTERLLTAQHVAELLGVSTETVLRWWRAGTIPGYRLGSNVLRFRESEVEDWLQGLRADVASNREGS
jgi:excisionase family DNA binding protein